MKLQQITSAIVALTIGCALAAPVMAQDSAAKKRQQDKNNMRNLGTGLGAVSAYELLRGGGNKTVGIIAAGGALYAGKKYEDARKAQQKENRIARVYRYRNGQRVGYYNYSNGHRIGSYHRLNRG